LTGARFTSIDIDPIQAPMWFGVSTDDAYTFALGLLGWMLEGLDNDQRGQALAALRATVTAHATTNGVIYHSAAWLIRAQRTKLAPLLSTHGPVSWWWRPTRVIA